MAAITAMYDVPPPATYHCERELMVTTLLSSTSLPPNTHCSRSRALSIPFSTKLSPSVSTLQHDVC